MKGQIAMIDKNQPPYVAAFFSDVEKQTVIKNKLTEVLDHYGLELPGTKDGFRALVESLNLKSGPAQAAYVALLKLAGTATQYYDFLEKTQRDFEKLSWDERNNLAVLVAFQLVSDLLDQGLNEPRNKNARRVLFSYDSPELRQLAAIIDTDPAKLKEDLIVYLKEEGLPCEEKTLN